MKKSFLLLLMLFLLSRQISAQMISLDDLHFLTMNLYSDSKKFLNGKGFVFVEHDRSFANIYNSRFLKAGKDSVVVGIVGDTVASYAASMQFKSAVMYKSFIKSITAKGYKLNPKLSGGGSYDLYQKPKSKTSYTITKNQEFSNIFNGKFYDILYHNDYHE